MTPTARDDATPRSRLERLLGLFTEVRGGEGISVLVLACNIFLILTAYYLIKPVREALILSVPHGAEVKSYAAAGQALLLLLAVPAYAALASRLPRLRLIDAVTVFFAACLVGFYLLLRSGVPVGVPFFLWVGIFNLMVPTQFWSFANDLYSPETGKRLFVLVAFGASAGAVAGSALADVLIAALGVHEMLLVAAALLVGTLALTHAVDARESRPGRAVPDAPVASTAEGSAFGLVFRNRYLLLVAVMLLLNNWVNSNGEYLLGHIVRDAAERPEAAGDPQAFIATFYARYFGVVNLLGLALQLFLVSRIIARLGVPTSIAILPALAVGSYLTIALFPVLGAVRWMKTAENATDYSLQGTLKQVLYLPTSREEKYKAKQAIDTLFVRTGDVCSAALVFVGSELLTLGVRAFALATVALALAWLAIAIGVGRRFGVLAPTPPSA